MLADCIVKINIYGCGLMVVANCRLHICIYFLSDGMILTGTYAMNVFEGWQGQGFTLQVWESMRLCETTNYKSFRREVNYGIKVEWERFSVGIAGIINQKASKKRDSVWKVGVPLSTSLTSRLLHVSQRSDPILECREMDAILGGWH